MIKNLFLSIRAWPSMELISKISSLDSAFNDSKKLIKIYYKYQTLSKSLSASDTQDDASPDISWECRVLGKSQRVSLADLSKNIAIAMITGKSVEMAAEIFPKTA